MNVQNAAKQQDRARITRALVVDAAAVEFAKRGYAAASINSILAASGRTKGALYFHFPSKDALAHAVLDEARARYTGIAAPWRERTDHPVRSMRGLMDDIASALTADPVLQADIHLGTDSGASFDRTRRASLSWEGVALELASAAQEKGCLKAQFTPERLVRSLVTVVAGQCLLSRLSTNASDVHTRYSESCGIVIAVMTTGVPSAV